MMIWVLFLPFFLDSLLVTVSDFIGLFWSSCYFNLSSLQISWSTRVHPGLPLLVFPLWAVESVLELNTLPRNGLKLTCRSGSRREASNAKPRKSLFHFKPEQVNKSEYCNNLWKQHNFFVTQCGSWKRDLKIICMHSVLCVCKSLCQLTWRNKLL